MPTNQKVGSSNLSGRTMKLIVNRLLAEKQPTHLPTQITFAR